jgi:hypothetical protein
MDGRLGPNALDLDQHLFECLAAAYSENGLRPLRSAFDFAKKMKFILDPPEQPAHLLLGIAGLACEQVSDFAPRIAQDYLRLAERHIDKAAPEMRVTEDICVVVPPDWHRLDVPIQRTGPAGQVPVFAVSARVYPKVDGTLHHCTPADFSR